MSRAISNGDGQKNDAARGTAETRNPKDRPLRASEPSVEGLQVGPMEGHPGRGMPRHDTSTIRVRYLELRNELVQLAAENPEAFIKAVDSVELDLNGDGPAFDNTGIRRLFNAWAAWGYDEHMAGTGHDRAVEMILRQLVEVDDCKRRYGGYPIFGDSLVELGCGTGTPIKLLSEIAPEDFRKMRIKANDITPEMIRRAQEKLAGMPNVDFSSLDICQNLDFGRRYGTAILSQTLPFIAEQALLLEENERRIPLEFTDHLDIKKRVLRGIFDSVLLSDGHFILIDEWPMTFTGGSRDPIAELKAQLEGMARIDPGIVDTVLRKAAIRREFFRYFRPIKDRSKLYNTVFRKNPFGARFVCEVKISIDGVHSMYGMVYRKDEGKLEPRERLLPVTRRNEDLRADATEMLLRTLQVTDKHFTTHFNPSKGKIKNWVEFTPIEGGKIYDSRKGGRLEPDASYDAVILVGKLHGQKPEDRQGFVIDAVNALKKGGALVVIEEWGVPKSTPFQVSKAEWRDVVLIPVRDRVMFQASFREPLHPHYNSGMYLYCYRKISDVPILP